MYCMNVCIDEAGTAFQTRSSYYKKRLQLLFPSTTHNDTVNRRQGHHHPTFAINIFALSACDTWYSMCRHSIPHTAVTTSFRCNSTVPSLCWYNGSSRVGSLFPTLRSGAHRIRSKTAWWTPAVDLPRIPSTVGKRTRCTVFCLTAHRTLTPVIWGIGLCRSIAW